MKKITALFLSLLMLLSLCACGSVNRQARSAPAAYESSFYAESPVAQEAAASYDMAGLSSANTAAARGGAFGYLGGFALMMTLDVALG